MTDTTTPLPTTPAERDRAALAKQSADAVAKLAQMTADYKASPGVRVEQLRAELKALDSNPYHLNREVAGNEAAASHRAALESRLRVAEAEVETVVREAF